MHEIITQTIGALAYLVIALSYFKKTKKSILIIQILAYILFTIHYSILMARTGTMCNILGLISLILIYIFDYYFPKKKNILIFILIPILVIISLLTYDNIYSIFPIIASVASLLSFTKDDENFIRLIGIVGATCWFIYAIVVGSYFAIIFEVITITSTIIAYYKNKEEKKNGRTNKISKRNKQQKNN